MKSKNWGRWTACVLLGFVDSILVSRVPRLALHRSHPDLHQFLFLGKSVAYWAFLLVYLTGVVICTISVVLLVRNRFPAWLTSAIRGMLSKQRSFSWADILLSATITVAVVCAPESLARATFIHRHNAPWMLLVPYMDRFDQSMALYANTQQSDQPAQNGVAAFRQARFEYRPYVGFTPVPEFRPMPATAKKAFRVFFVGGSAMEISASKTVQDVQERLNQSGCNIEVINAGRSAYVSGQEVVMTLMELLPLQPDLVIVFDGYNDLSRVEEGEAPGNPEYTRAMAAAFKSGLSPYRSVISDLAQRSFLVQLLKQGRGEAPVAVGDQPVFEDAVKIYGLNIERMSALASSNKFRLVVAVQPLVFFRDQLGPSENQLVARHPKRAELYRHYYPRLVERAKTAVTAEGASLRDLSRVFAGVSGDVFYDGVHFDGENAAVREALGAEFENMIRAFSGRCS